MAWGADYILIDDGFQCHRLHRDINIVLLNGETVLNWPNLLPFGRLRESPKALERADLIVINNTRVCGEQIKIRQRLEAFSYAPVLLMAPQISLPETKLSGVFCGLGRPMHFIASLQQAQIPIASQLILSDHETPTQKLWSSWIEKCLKLGIEQLLCTEKDYHRFLKSPATPIPIIPVPMSLEPL
jgi:tetraacyldisaccharide 4'-kinase